MAAVRKLAAIIGQGDKGLALARALVREGITTRAQMRRPDVLRRLSRASRSNVLYPAARVPLRTAERIVEDLKRRIYFDPPIGRFEVTAVGSIRRKAPSTTDIDILITADGADLRGLRVRASASTQVADVYVSGGQHCMLKLAKRSGSRTKFYKVDFFITTLKEKPYALFHRTGSTRYNIRTRAHAKRQGWKLNQYGLFDRAGKRVHGTSAIRTEQDLARFLGVTYRRPEDRTR